MTRQEKAQAKRNRRAFWRKDPSNYALRNVGSGEAEREAWRRKPRKAEVSVAVAAVAARRAPALLAALALSASPPVIGPPRRRAAPGRGGAR